MASLDTPDGEFPPECSYTSSWKCAAEKNAFIGIGPIYFNNADAPNTNDHFFRRGSWRGVVYAHEKPA